MIRRIARTLASTRMIPPPVARVVRRVWSRRWIREPVRVLLGAYVGGLLGFFLTMGIFVAQARAGRYVYSLHDITALRWEMIPTFAGILAGAWAGWRDFPTLGAGVVGALLGAIVLAPLGWFAGPWLWVGRSAPWAGAVLAAAVGLGLGLVGAVVLRIRRARRHRRSM